MKKLLLLLALMVAPAFAQTATVIELTAADANQARSAYLLKLEADKAWDQVNARIRAAYTHTEFAWPELEYTPDFRFLAPKYSNYCGTVITGAPGWNTIPTSPPSGTIVLQ